MEQPSDFEKATMSKILWKLMPFLCVCYMAAFLDRVNLSFAKSAMATDLQLDAEAYGAGAGIFFIGYFFFEVPSNLILERIGARVWIARIMVTWGVISSAMMFVTGEWSFYSLRFLLGAAEAGFFPGAIYYMTQWFPAAYRSRTVAIFMTAAVASNVIGSPISGLLLELDGTLGLHGWQWLFLIEGLPSVVLGVLVLRLLPNGPHEAKWLSEEERGWLESRIDSERARAAGTGPGKHGSHVSLVKALTDLRVVLLCAVYFCNVVGGYGLDFFQPTLIKKVFPNASLAEVGYVNAIPALLTIFVMNLHGRSSDRKAERKWHLVGAMWWAASGLFLASLPLPPAVTLTAFVLAVSGRWSAIAPFWGLSTAFLSGRAAAGAIALINSIGNLGGHVGPSLMGWLEKTTGSNAAGLRIIAAVVFCGGLLAATAVRGHSADRGSR
jgi:ACS family tartrate transporter-like MFS transporter